MDLARAGLSGADPSGDYSAIRSLQILAALMDSLGLARASLIGNSTGGRIAWRFAAEFPSRVDKQVLVSPEDFASPGFEHGRKPDVPSMQHVLPKPSLNLAAAYAALTDGWLAITT